MTSIQRAVAAIAAILAREGVDYSQSKAVFKAARARAGLRAPAEKRGGVDRLSVEEELRFLDHAYAQDGRTGLMLQTLLETGVRASELVQLRVEDVSLTERVVTIRRGKGSKRREVPIRRELAQLLRLHIGTRRAGPLFASRQRGTSDLQRFLGHESITTTRHYAETTAATLKRKFDALSDTTAHELVTGIRRKLGDDAALLAADLLAQRRAERVSNVGA